MSSPLFRILLRTVFCLALGAATAIGVAWGIALRTTPTQGWNDASCVAWAAPVEGEVVVLSRPRPSANAQCLHLRSGPGFINDTTIQRAFTGGLLPLTGLGPLVVRVPGPPLECHPPSGRADHRTEYQFGWPYVCAWAASDISSGGSDRILILGNRHTLRVWPISEPSFSNRSVELDNTYAPFDRLNRRQVWFVPVGILWRGITIDSLVFGSAWWVVIFAPGMLLREFRRRRALCRACGYPVGISPVCTECGKPVKPRPAAPA